MGKYKYKGSGFFQSSQKSHSDIQSIQNSSNVSLEIAEQDDDDSAYESDNGTMYKPVSLNEYKVRTWHVLRPSEAMHKNRVYVNRFNKIFLRYLLEDHHEVIHDGLIKFTDILKPKEKKMFNPAQLNSEFFTDHEAEILQYLVKQKIIRNGTIGQGSYVNAREFSAPNERSRVVLDPISVDVDANGIRECLTKFEFFSTFYENEKTELFLNGNDYNTYRIVTFKAPGKSYNKFVFSDEKKQVQVFIATIRALKRLHQSGSVYIDLKSDNIYYKEPIDTDDVGLSSPIDGGFRTNVGHSISSIFICKNEVMIKRKQMDFSHIAPECWSLNPVLAHPSMDVYSLGMLMQGCLKNPSAKMSTLIQRCTSQDANHRPLLDELEQELIQYLDILSGEWVLVKR